MPLNTIVLASDLKDALNMAMGMAEESSIDPADVQQAYANAVSEAIRDFVKGITITIGSGIIQTQGSAVAQSNVVPIVVTNTPPSSIS